MKDENRIMLFPVFIHPLSFILHPFFLALTLLVLRVLADDANHALTLDNLALIADFFDRCSYLHIIPSLLGYSDGRGKARKRFAAP